jgi:RimJ/RimL family protein N-acetyltransferase
MALPPDGRSLVGRTVRLDPTSEHDAEYLFHALDDDRVWEMGYGGSRPRPTSPGEWRYLMNQAVKDYRVMYIVRTVDPTDPEGGRIIGTTSLGDLDLTNEKVHLGWTAYTPEVWSTTVNPECKLLLLWHCFEHCGLGRVKLRTDLINVRSQAAIEKLGATREGVARRHIKRADDTWRDSVIYSVIAEDWPRVKAGLESRLAGLGAT